MGDGGGIGIGNSIGLREIIRLLSANSLYGMGFE
jgi:hypothetical protein